MEVFDALLNRRSVRRYKPDLPAREDLEKIAEAGLYAASGKGMQTVRIVVVTNPELIQKLREWNRVIGGWGEDVDPFYGAPALLLVLADRASPNHVYDGALAMGNMMLAAHALGLGSCWINRARQAFDTEEGKALLNFLGVEGDLEGIGHCIVGYPDGPAPKAAPRKPGRVVWAE